MRAESTVMNSLALFRGVEGLEETTFMQCLNVKKYGAGQQIIASSDASTDIFFVLQGAVIAQGYAQNGKEITYSYLGQGEMFGEFAAVDGGDRSATIETVEESTIARITSSDFRAIIAENPQLGLRLAEHLVAKSRELSQRMFEFGTLSVSGRVQAELLRLCEANAIVGNECAIDPAPTHHEIANRIATHREAVSREFSHLVSLGLIKAGRKTIQILNVATLRKMVENIDV